MPALRRYIRELTAGSWRRVAITVGLALAVAVTEGLGLLLLLPLLEVAGVAVNGGVAGELALEVKARLALLGVPITPAVVLGSYVVVMAARALLVRASVLACVRLQERFLLERRQLLYRAMLEARWESLAGHRDGELTHALTAELENAADAPSNLLSILTGGLLALVYLGLAFRLSVPVTLIAALGGAALLLVLRRRRHAARRAAHNVHEITAELFASAAEHVDGLKTTKAYGAERRSEQRFAGDSAAVADANEDCERLFANARALLDVGAVVVLAVAIYVAHDVMNLGTAAILVLLYIFARVTPRLAGLQSAYQQLMLAMPPFARASQAIDRWRAATEGASEDAAAPRLRHALVLLGVRYRYPALPDSLSTAPAKGGPQQTARPPALRDATLSIAAGATTAIVGPSGAGKSTLADMVLGLLYARTGRVEIDGIELTPARARAWRQRVGYVAQETYLFNDTVRANLRWACPEASDDDIREALTLAAADRFVRALPDGLDTVVGERGRRLSCGERQRLTLARALLRRPDLLMLDEATSNVDAENERVIQRAVESLKGRMTMLLITHRLASTRTADVIYVIDRGRIVESGDFETLVRRGGRFAELCSAQGIGTTAAPPALATTV
jgi:ATP-binding cassette subfamily C protein